MAGLGGSSTGLRRGTGLLASDSASGLKMGTGLSGDTGSTSTGNFILLAGGTTSRILLAGGGGFIKLAGT